MSELNSEFKIGAYWYPGWKTNDAGSRASAGGGDPWASNDPASGSYAGTFIGDTATFPSQKPLIGYYDESSQSVIDALLADISGTIDFIAFDWYVKPSTSTIQFSHAIDKFRTSPNKTTLQFCVAWINDHGYYLNTLAYFDWAVSQIIGYFADSQYLTKDGKPVLIIYDMYTFCAIPAIVWSNYPTAVYKGAWLTGQPYNSGEFLFTNNIVYECLVGHTSGTFATDLAASKWVARTASLTNVDYGAALRVFADRIRAAAVAAGYSGCYLVGCNDGHPFSTSDYGIGKLGGFDAMTAYNYQNGYTNYRASASGGSATQAYDSFGAVASGGAPTFVEMDWTYRTQWFNNINLATESCKYWVPICAGWDKRPWTTAASRYPTVTTAAAKHAGNCAPNWTDYKEHLIAAKEAMSNTSRTDGFGIIYALNEWGEGGYLFSTEQDGRTKLDMIDNVFSSTSTYASMFGRQPTRDAVIYLDGTTNGVVTIADHAALQITDKYTLMIRWKCATTAPDGYLCGRLNSSNDGGYGMYLKYHGDGVTVDPGNVMGQIVQTASRAERNLNTCEATSWHHMAISYDATPAAGSRVSKIYIDGVLKSTNSTLSRDLTVVSAINFLVGNRTSGGGAGTTFNGWVCDLKLYNRILSADEILADKNGTEISNANLVIDMPMDDATGTTAVNNAASGVGNGTLGSGATWITRGAYPGVMPKL